MQEQLQLRIVQLQNGDITTIDFEGFVDGVAFEGGKGTDYRADTWFRYIHPGIRGAACWSKHW